MPDEIFTSVTVPELDPTALFEALPGSCILLQNNAPHYTVLAATPEYLAQTGYRKEAIIGKGVFEMSPANPDDPSDTGVSNLSASLAHVRSHKQAHYLTVQRYDIAGENGSFSERYWQASNKPVFAPNGDVAYIIHSAENITGQVKAEKREVQLEGIEKAFALFMHAPMVVGLVDGEDYVLKLANEEAFKLWGKGPEIIGKPILQTLPELQSQGIIELFEQVRVSGKPFIADEVPVKSFVGGKEVLHFFNLVYQPYFGIGSRQASGVFTISHDVTEQVRSRQRAEESEERFRSMADASPVMIWTLDPAGNSTYYNKRATDFTGHSAEELRAGTSWQMAIHPDDIAFAGGVVGTAVEKQQPYQMECRMRRADGAWRWLLSHGTPRFGKNHELLGYVGSSVDITEFKKSQQELQTALEQVRLSKEAAELGTFDMNLEKGTMHWDDRCRTLFGISHHDAVTYESDFVGGLHPDDRQRIIEVIDQLFVKPISQGDYDVEYRTVGAEDGVIRWVRAKGKVYFNSEEKPVRFIGSVLDITEKVTAIQKIEALVEERTRQLAQTNEILQATNKELQRSNQNLEEFAHAASHDLKEPVRKIHFFTQQLKEQLKTHVDEGQARSFSRIENATERMGNLIDDLLLYSHVSQRPKQMEKVDLNQKLQNVLEDLELDIEEKKAVIRVNPLPVVNGHGRQLQQMFQNLFSNSLKYSKDHVVPRIEVSAREVKERNKKFHLIVVRDNGIGFAPEYAEKIFQMFTRLHGRNEYSGTGVGLSIVKKVVENHNGFITAESAVGEGSVFNIYLPL